MPYPGGGPDDPNPPELSMICWGPNPNPPGGGPPPDSKADVIWSMILWALSWPRAGNNFASIRFRVGLESR